MRPAARQVQAIPPRSLRMRPLWSWVTPGATPQPARVNGFGEPYCSPTTGTETTNPQFAGPRWVFARSYSGMDQPTTQSLGDSLRIKSGQRERDKLAHLLADPFDSTRRPR